MVNQIILLIYERKLDFVERVTNKTLKLCSIVDEGESEFEAAKRELKEETNIDLDEETLKPLGEKIPKIPLFEFKLNNKFTNKRVI